MARFWHVTYASPHTDEAFTFALAALSPRALIAAVIARDFHPPLFYLATHALLLAVTKPRWDYRVVTAAFGCLTVAATFGAARRAIGPLAAVFAALFVALVPALVQYDRIYRMYAVTVALSALSFWLLAYIEQVQGRRRPWLIAGYATTIVVLPWIDYLGIFVIAAQSAYALGRPRLRWPILVSAGLSALAFCPWLGALNEQLPLGGLVLTRPGLDQGLTASFQGAFAAGTPPLWLGTNVGWLCVACVACLSLAGMWLGRATFLPFWLAVLWVQVGCSIALGKNLAYFPRYLLVDIPPLCIALALVLERLWLQSRVIASAAAAVVLAFFSTTLGNVLLDPYYQFPNWYALNAVMFGTEQPGDAIVLDAGYEALVLNDHTAFRGRELLSSMNPSEFAPILHWIATHPDKRIWYVEHQHYYWDPQRRIAGALGNREVLLMHRWPRRWPVDDVSVMLFNKVPMTIR